MQYIEYTHMTYIWGWANIYGTIFGGMKLRTVLGCASVLACGFCSPVLTGIKVVGPVWLATHTICLGYIPVIINSYDMITLVVIMIVIIVMILNYHRYNCFFHSYDMMNSHLIAGAHGKNVVELATFRPEDTYEPNDAESIQTLGLM